MQQSLFEMAAAAEPAALAQEQPQPSAPAAKRAPVRHRPQPTRYPVNANGQREQVVTLRLRGGDIPIGWATEVGERWQGTYCNPTTHRKSKLPGTFGGAHGAAQAVYEHGIKVERKRRKQQEVS